MLIKVFIKELISFMLFLLGNRSLFSVCRQLRFLGKIWRLIEQVVIHFVNRSIAVSSFNAQQPTKRRVS